MKSEQLVDNIGVAVIGGTGYGAGELLRLFTMHDKIELVSCVSSSVAGEEIAKHHPHLNGFYPGVCFSSEIDFDKLSSFKKSVVFSALPHNTSSNIISSIFSELEKRGIKLVDLSGDFRLENLELHKYYYPDSLSDKELRKKFVYGLPELNKEKIKSANYVANVGCLASACSLAVLPININEISSSVVFDAKTGSSGAGKGPSASLHHPQRASEFNAYKVLEHRHEPEILQTLGDAKGEILKTFFVPHLIPVSRGIYVTAYLELKKEESREDLFKRYESYYKDSPFIRLVKDTPKLGNVVGTNFCDISIVVRKKQVVLLLALDNLVKGAAGVAIENMNLMCGLEQTHGLMQPALGPVF